MQGLFTVGKQLQQQSNSKANETESTLDAEYLVSPLVGH